MPTYHSAFNDLQTQEACGCAILPIKTRSRGPAPIAPEGQNDIVDEIIQLFRANVLFTNFEIKGNADRVLIYGTLFVHLCLKKLDKCTTKPDGTFTAMPPTKANADGWFSCSCTSADSCRYICNSRR